MDDYNDEFDDELDEESEDFDDDLDDDLNDVSDSDFSDASRDLTELEDMGVMDGQQDAIAGNYYLGFGVSVDDFDSLSEEEKGAYEMGYMTGFNAGGGWG